MLNSKAYNLTIMEYLIFEIAINNTLNDKKRSKSFLFRKL